MVAEITQIWTTRRTARLRVLVIVSLQSFCLSCRRSYIYQCPVRPSRGSAASLISEESRAWKTNFLISNSISVPHTTPSRIGDSRTSELRTPYHHHTSFQMENAKDLPQRTFAHLQTAWSEKNPSYELTYTGLPTPEAIRCCIEDQN